MGKTGFCLLGAWLVIGAAAFAGESAPAQPQPPKSPAEMFEFHIGGVLKVVEAAEPITMRYALAKSPLAPNGAVKTVGPIIWTVKDGDGKVLMEATSEAPSPSGEFAIKAKEAWPLGKLVVSASSPFTGEIQESIEAGAPRTPVSSSLTAKVAEFVVKPDGWREATYRQVMDELHVTLRANLDQHAFEFPELRDLQKVTYDISTRGAIGRITLFREALDVDSEKQTARLKKHEGFLEFAAVDPVAPREMKADARGLVQDGLVAIDMRCEMPVNPHLINALPKFEIEIIEAMGGKVAWPVLKPSEDEMPEPYKPKEWRVEPPPPKPAPK